MNYSIITSAKFDRELKRLSKKYSSLKREYAELIDSLETNPLQGTPIAHGCNKIRISIASKGRGKSGGARVITYVYVQGKTVYLLSIYDKSEQESLSDKELEEILKTIQ